jgi:hypothetical protein
MILGLKVSPEITLETVTKEIKLTAKFKQSLLLQMLGRSYQEFEGVYKGRKLSS